MSHRTQLLTVIQLLEATRSRTDGIWLGLQKGVENSDPTARSPGEKRIPCAKNAEQCSPLRVASGSLEGDANMAAH